MRRFLGALVLLFGGLFYLVVFRFFVPLFLAALFAMLFQPLHGWMIKQCRDSAGRTRREESLGGRMAGPDPPVLIHIDDPVANVRYILDPQNKIRHAEYVKEVADHPDYEAALNAARGAVALTA